MPKLTEEELAVTAAACEEFKGRGRVAVAHDDANAPSLHHYPTGWWLYWNEGTSTPNCVHAGPVLAAAWLSRFAPDALRDGILDVTRADVVFHWTEGNYGCDCNRELFFARAGGEPEPDTECTEDRFTAEVLPT